MVGAGEKLLAVQVHLLILGAAGTAADGHIIQVCAHQSGSEIASGPPAYSGYPANGRPTRRRDHIPARAPDAEPECSPVYRTRDWSAGACHLRVPSTRTGACMSSNTMVTAFRRQLKRRRARTERQTAGGRLARTRRLMGQSATPALPGSGATLPDAAQTALSRDQHGYGNIHRVTVHPTSGRTALQQTLTYFRSVYGNSGIRQSRCDGVTRSAGREPPGGTGIPGRRPAGTLPRCNRKT